MNPAWWLIAPLALVVVWWLAGRPGWPGPRHGEGREGAATTRSRESGGLRSSPASALDDEAGSRDFAPTTVVPHAQDELRREQDEQNERAARAVQAARAASQAAEHEAALRAAYRAAEQAQARRVAEREAAEARARQRAADEHAQRELLRQQREAEAAQAAQRLAAEAAAQAEAARLAAAAPPPAPSRLPEQTLVMVVDDSKVVRVKTSRLLAKHQYRVALAEDGEKALQQIAGEAPQVLITDVEMPGIDGVELTRRVRANALTAQLPIIMITSADDRMRSVADAVGVSVLLGKPYADEALIASIEQLAGIAPAARLSAA